MQICLGKKKELPIEYHRYALVYEDFSWRFYHITSWIGDNYFKTKYGSFLFDDSKAKIYGKIKTKDKLIIKLLCLYDVDDISEQPILRKVE